MIGEIILIIMLGFLLVWLKHEANRHAMSEGSDRTVIPFYIFESLYALNPTRYQLHRISAIYQAQEVPRRHRKIYFSISDTLKYMRWQHKLRRGLIVIDSIKAQENFNQTLQDILTLLDKEM